MIEKAIATAVPCVATADHGVAEPGEGAFDQVRERGLADPAEAERREGDPELSAGNRPIEVVVRLPDLEGQAVALLDELVDPGLPHGDQRELRGDEEPVREDEDEDGEQLQRRRHRPGRERRKGSSSLRLTSLGLGAGPSRRRPRRLRARRDRGESPAGNSGGRSPTARPGRLRSGPGSVHPDIRPVSCIHSARSSVSASSTPQRRMWLNSSSRAISMLVGLYFDDPKRRHPCSRVRGERAPPCRRANISGLPGRRKARNSASIRTVTADSRASTIAHASRGTMIS